MTEADSILAGERSRNRPDRIVNAFAPGYVIAESDETNNTMCYGSARRRDLSGAGQATLFQSH